MQLEKIYTVEEAAPILKIKPKTLYKHIRNDVIGHTRIGGRILITETDLKAALSRRHTSNENNNETGKEI